MPYYLISNKKIVSSMEDLSKQYKAQRKKALSVIKEFGTTEAALNDRGLHGIVVKDETKFDKKLWCRVSNKLAPNFIKPRRSAKDLRRKFNSVPSINKGAFLDTIGWEVSWDSYDGRVLFSPQWTYIGKTKKWVIFIPDWSVKSGKELIKLPGVKEITMEQFIKLGGKVDEN